MKKYITAIVMAAVGAVALMSQPSQAGSYCVQDPPRPTDSVGPYVAQKSSSKAHVTTDNSYELYDASGDPFRIRGANHNHWDQANTYAGLPLTGANAVRIVMKGSLGGNAPAMPGAGNAGVADATYTAAMLDRFLDSKLLPIPGDWRGTCRADLETMDLISASWKANYSIFSKYDGKVIWNLANEWGPNAGTTVYDSVKKTNTYVPNYTWRDGSIRGLLAMRSAGYRGLIMIDAGNCGQDATTVSRDGPTVLAADPLKNVIFDVHVYGGFHKPATASWMQDYTTAFTQLKMSGLPLIIGEFGPGRNVGPSPTLVTPETIIQTAEDNGWGWLAWAYGDNNLKNCQGNDLGFSMTIDCGKFTGVVDKDGNYPELTTFGNVVTKSFVRLNAMKVTP